MINKKKNTVCGVESLCVSHCVGEVIMLYAPTEGER